MKRAVVGLNEHALPIDPRQIFHHEREGVIDALELSILLANNWLTKLAVGILNGVQKTVAASLMANLQI
jgi:hypothetical protein